jgi:hypothetical protein
MNHEPANVKGASRPARKSHCRDDEPNEGGETARHATGTRDSSHIAWVGGTLSRLPGRSSRTSRCCEQVSWLVRVRARMLLAWPPILLTCDVTSNEPGLVEGQDLGQQGSGRPEGSSDACDGISCRRCLAMRIGRRGSVGTPTEDPVAEEWVPLTHVARAVQPRTSREAPLRGGPRHCGVSVRLWTPLRS